MHDCRTVHVIERNDVHSLTAMQFSPELRAFGILARIVGQLNLSITFFQGSIELLNRNALAFTGFFLSMAPIAQHSNPLTVDFCMKATAGLG